VYVPALLLNVKEIGMQIARHNLVDLRVIKPGLQATGQSFHVAGVSSARSRANGVECHQHSSHGKTYGVGKLRVEQQVSGVDY